MFSLGQCWKREAHDIINSFGKVLAVADIAHKLLFHGVIY